MQPHNPPSYICIARVPSASGSLRIFALLLLSTLTNSALAQAPQPGSTRSFKTICGGLHVQGKDLIAQCAGTVEFSIPSEAELKAGKRPTIRIGYGADKYQLWELGDPKNLPPTSSAVKIIVARIDGKPAEGWCDAQTYSQAVGLACNSFIAAEGAASVNDFNVTYTNVPGGTATGSPLELLDYFRGMSVLLGGSPAPALVAASPTPAPAPAPKSAAPPKPMPAAPSAEPYKPSSDPKAIFGLMVGKPGPATLPKCRYKDLLSPPTFAPNQAYCFSEEGTGLEALLGGLKEDLTINDYQGLGLLPMSININEAMYDTSITQNVTIFKDRDNIIQRVKITTFLVSHQDIMSMLMKKYGKPAKEDWTIWSNRQTGAEVERTPNYFWDFPGISVDYISRATGLLNGNSLTGSIDVYTATYSRMINEYLKKRDAPPPGRKPM